MENNIPPNEVISIDISSAVRAARALKTLIPSIKSKSKKDSLIKVRDALANASLIHINDERYQDET